TRSSAGQQEDPPRDPAGARAGRTRRGCSYKVTTPGGRAYRALWRPVGSTFPESVLPAHLRYACVVCPLAPASRCTPGRDEHQLVRGAAGGPADRANRRATPFAPGAGAPTGL